MNIILFEGGGIALANARGEYPVRLVKVGPDNWTAELLGFHTVDGMSIMVAGVDELDALTGLMEWADEAERDWAN